LREKARMRASLPVHEVPDLLFQLPAFCPAERHILTSPIFEESLAAYRPMMLTATKTDVRYPLSRVERVRVRASYMMFKTSPRTPNSRLKTLDIRHRCVCRGAEPLRGDIFVASNLFESAL